MRRLPTAWLAGLWCLAATAHSPVSAQVLKDAFPSTTVNASLWSVDILGHGPGYGQGGGLVAMLWATS